MALKLIPAYGHTREVGELFSEYTDMLVAGDASFKDYLDIQNYDEELQHLECKYGSPSGRLYLAYYDEELAGCIGLRKIDESNCEMKRLYVRQKFRGKQNALSLYKAFGFYEIESYNNSSMDTSIFMRMDL